MSGLEAQVRRAAARVLRVPSARIEREAPLARYGLDSLSSVELAAALAEIAGREFSDELLVEHASVAAIACYLERGAGRRGPPLERMAADSVLPGDVARAGGAPGDAILVTGAWGFLGSQLVEVLLRETERPIICLARSPHAPASPRVRVVAGDIERPRLGLEPARYTELCGAVGEVFHCAARVDWSLGYEALRGTNVLGTLELLRFASRGARKAFHYVSSVSTCYSTRSRGVVAEADTQPVDPAGMHLGYAQSKWVAEALVREARRRGLEATIYRPALIAGHSVTGSGNNQDFLARLIKGCILVGAAPDISWRMDACPVDFVAAAIDRLARERLAVAHIVNPRRAGWLEAVLWMNLRGYRLRLMPYPRWAALVESEARDPAQPLHALRGFLLHRPAGEEGCYLPELFAAERLGSVADAATRALLARAGLECPRLEPRLLETWFDAYRRSGFLPPVARRPIHSHAQDLHARLEDALQRRIFSMREFALGTESSILGELASWRAGAALALRGYELEVETRGARRRLSVVLKPRLDDETVLEVAAEVAALCDPRLGAVFRAQCRRTALAGTAAREIALYRHGNAALRAHSPACYGVVETGGTRALVLEHVGDIALNHADARWCGADIEAALRGIAEVHAQELGDCVQPEDEAAELWCALAAHARPWIARWAGEAAAARLARRPWAARRRAAGPLRPIHHDFNPRNIGLRRSGAERRLCAFDWELATLGAPQRDLAELLCFVLRPDTPAAQVARYVEFHRRCLGIERSLWLHGFRLALDDFAVQRLSMYVLAHRFRPQPYLERVSRTWARLAALSLEETVDATA